MLDCLLLVHGILDELEGVGLAVREHADVEEQVPQLHHRVGQGEQGLPVVLQADNLEEKSGTGRDARSGKYAVDLCRASSSARSRPHAAMRRTNQRRDRRGVALV